MQNGKFTCRRLDGKMASTYFISEGTGAEFRSLVSLRPETGWSTVRIIALKAALSARLINDSVSSTYRSLLFLLHMMLSCRNKGVSGDAAAETSSRLLLDHMLRAIADPALATPAFEAQNTSLCKMPFQ